MSSMSTGHGDLNNTSVLRRAVQEFRPEPEYAYRSLAIPESHDDLDIRTNYRPFLLRDDIESCDVRVYDPRGLPVKDDTQHDHPKVQELRELSKWSDGHVWICPEQHGTITAVFKNQIDWIPLSTGSVRPTQGRTLAIAQVNGGSQSFNTVNSLRILGRWMRMFAIPNQSSVPQAYTQFTDIVDEGQSKEYREAEGGSRMKPSGNRDRLVDCMEELVKYTILMRPQFDLFNDRYSERMANEAKRQKEEEESKKRTEGM
ncbi:hypothetical protein B0A50_03173 [Salinomyces thailandicus]|uniref:NADPH-dependent FMN reductase-like domain-containing protein n=1 Tax=Salinomyces thailandicus TaxID=706561 RepID=A0A4V5N6S5_9PEZI|nr:hypothetical protein B0A50_03173 [Salinomyces thailandica]